MEERDERDDGESEAEKRLARARQSIGRTFDELISRVGSEGADEEEPDAQGAEPTEPEVDPDDEDLIPPAPAYDSHQGVPAGVEERLGAWVNARVEAAERRLELQSKALEAALGEEAVSARRAAEQVERAREALVSATEIALRAVGESIEGAKAELSIAAAERAESALAETEIRVRGLGTSLQDELRDTIVGSNEKTVERSVEEATARVRSEVELSMRGARELLSGEFGNAEARLKEVVETTGAERSSELNRRVTEVERVGLERVESGLERAIERLRSANERAAKGAVDSARDAAEELLEARMAAAEEALGRRSEGERAAIEARITELEAGVRERVEGAVSAGMGKHAKRLDSEATVHREALEHLRVDAEEARRRGEARLAELDASIPAQVEREIARATEAATNRLENTNQLAATRQSAEASKRLESIVSREASKAEARLATESQRIELLVNDGREALALAIEGAQSQIAEQTEERVARATEARLSEARIVQDEREKEAQAQLVAEITRALNEVDRRVGEARQTLDVASHQAVEAGLESARGQLAQDVERQILAGLDAAREELSRTGADGLAEARRSLEHLARSTAAAEAEAALGAAEARLDQRYVNEQETRAKSIAEQLENLSAEVHQRTEQGTGEAASMVEARLADRMAAIERQLVRENEAHADQRLAALDQQVDAKLAKASTRLEASMGSAAEAAVADAHRQASSDAEKLAAAAIEQAHEQVRTDLEASLKDTVASGAEQTSKAVRAELEGDAAKLRTEIADLREELDKKRIRSERDRISAELDQQKTETLGSLQAEGHRLAEGLQERSSETVERSAAEIAARAEASTADLEGVATTSRAKLEQHSATLRSEIERAVGERADAALQSGFERRMEALDSGLQERMAALEQRVAGIVEAANDRTEQRLGESDEAVRERVAAAERRLAEAAEAAESRLAAAERAQEREEAVRARTAAAEQDSERRVREAEQRLIEVMSRIDSAEPRSG